MRDLHGIHGRECWADIMSNTAREAIERAVKALDEAGELLGIAWSAMLKNGLSCRGDDCRLPHEIRVFALAFSREERDGPGALQVKGTGRFERWDEATRQLMIDLRHALAATAPEEKQ